MDNMKKLCSLIIILMSVTAVFAQYAIVPVGGDAQSNSGSVSYTVGQIAVQTTANSSGSIAVTEGVQQPYEIQTVGVDNYPQISLNAVIYPNPTENIAQLQLNGFEIPANGLRAILYDGNGKQLQSVTITDDLTPFQIGQYATGTYYLELRDGKQVLKTFKVVRNASNALVVNTQVGVRVNILQGSATGNAVYSESHMATTNANGLITVNIGGGSVLHGTFADIDWSDGPYFLKTDLDPNGGNDYTITSVQQLLSVPYALYAKDAGNGFSGDYNDLVNVPQIPQFSRRY